eukprot:m51a1_g8855 hypothetical protein (2098) ;mRNA; f:500840-512262
MLLLLLACSAAAVGASGFPPVSSGCASVKDIVIGLSVDDSSVMQLNAALGLRAAIDEVRQLTALPLRLVPLNHTREDELVTNIVELVTNRCALIVVGRPGNSRAEVGVLDALKHYNVPLVGPLSGSEGLRDTTTHVGVFKHKGATVRLPLVVNVRASGGDELNEVVQVLARDWASLGSVALLAHSTPFGRWSHAYINSVLRALGFQNISAALLDPARLSEREVTEAAAELFSAGKEPKSIVVCTLPWQTSLLIRWLARSGHSSTRLYLLSWSSAAGLNRLLDGDPETRALLARNGIALYITQSMPFPTPPPDRLAASPTLLQRFGRSAVSARTHAALEGYLTGWFIYEVAQQSANRHGLPLTRDDFLSTVFLDVRAFNVLDVRLGPYGDGGRSGEVGSRQAEEEACNQGVHEVFMTRYDPLSGTLSQMPSSSLRFSGCMTPRATSAGVVAQVGLSVARGSAEDTAVHAGLQGAVRFHNSEAKDTLVLRTSPEDTAAVAQQWGTRVVAIVRPHLESIEDARRLAKRIINLFPSAIDEAVAALKFFHYKGLLRGVGTLRLLNSRVVAARDGLADADPVGENATYRLSVSPPVSNFSTYSGLRYDYSQWVSSEDTGDASFESFFVGRFLSQVVSIAQAKSGAAQATAKDVIDAVYSRGTFDVGGVQVGPFRDASKNTMENCNQGLGTVYVVRGLRGQHLEDSFTVGDCGRDYVSQGDAHRLPQFNAKRFIGLIVGIGVALVVCILVLAVVVVRSKRSVEFFNIRRGELELGQCLGKGRRGSLFMADWHGTTVAVRVIDKKATPKEDQRLIKEEVLLLHKHHHPNLLMLMGYCETKSDLLVVIDDFYTLKLRTHGVPLQTLSFLGEGETSQVFQATLDGDEVAVKVLRKEFITSSTPCGLIRNEAAVLQNLAGISGVPELVSICDEGFVFVMKPCANLLVPQSPSLPFLRDTFSKLVHERGYIAGDTPTLIDWGHAVRANVQSPYYGSLCTASDRVLEALCTERVVRVTPADDLVSLVRACLLSVMPGIVPRNSDPPVSSVCATLQEVVVGISVDATTMQQNMANGLSAALAEASPLTKVPLKLRTLSGGSSGEDVQLAANVEKLVRDECAFVVVGMPGNTADEIRVMATLGKYNVPLVSTLTGSEDLRDLKNHLGVFKRNVRLPLVVNVRASGGDELNEMLQVLSSDWATLGSVSLLAHSTPFGNWSHNYTDSVLRSLANTSLLTTAFIPADNPTETQYRTAAAELFPPGKEHPKAVLVCTHAGVTWRIIRWLAVVMDVHNTKFYLASWASASTFSVMLNRVPEVRERLLRNGISLYFTQSMPFPTPPPDRLAASASLLQRFNENSAVTIKSHAALEGYLTGWFIYEAIQQTVARYGLPLTRVDFLTTVFVDVRTFNVLDVRLGPYGDGGLSGGAGSRQGTAEACNQGVHEVFMTRYNLSDSTLAQMPGSSLRFDGCRTPRVSSPDVVTEVAMAVSQASAGDMAARSGLLGAIRYHNSQGADAVVMLRTAAAIPAREVRQWRAGGLVALVSPRLESPLDADSLAGVALISPTPGYHALRRPFDRHAALCMALADRLAPRRRVVNLFPSASDEAAAAFLFFRAKNVSRVTVIVNSDSEHSQECSKVISKHINTTGVSLKTVNEDATSFILRSSAATAGAFFVIGGTLDSSLLTGVSIPRLLNSEVVDTSTDTDEPIPAVESATFRLRVSPPLNNFSTYSGLRRDYARWVSSEGTDDRAFESFIVGRFLSLVVEHARLRHGGAQVTVEDLVEAVYSKSTFDIGGLQIGPFVGRSRDTLDNCNQGLDTVYVVQGGWFGAVYMADWHGTTVAVRVIDKKATPKEDQRLIKEEVLLLHKHHHPNLLMLMGYCETRNELLMDAKGTVKVSDFWYSNKRGAFSSSGSGKSLKKAAWQPPEVIAGTFLTPATDVYAFGIVLWELIAPPDMTTSSSSSSMEFQASGPPSMHSINTGISDTERHSVGLGGIVAVQDSRLGPPEIPPNASPEVADLLEHCWQTQPERRPSIFQILRNWPTTFASLGAFEIPCDLDMAPAAAPLSPSNGEHNAGKPSASGVTDEMMAASMMSIMPHKDGRASVQMQASIAGP